MVISSALGHHWLSDNQSGKNHCCLTISVLLLPVQAVIFLFAASADSWLYVNVLMCICDQSIL